MTRVLEAGCLWTGPVCVMSPPLLTSLSSHWNWQHWMCPGYNMGTWKWPCRPCMQPSCRNLVKGGWVMCQCDMYIDNQFATEWSLGYAISTKYSSGGSSVSFLCVFTGVAEVPILERVALFTARYRWCTIITIWTWSGPQFDVVAHYIAY